MYMQKLCQDHDLKKSGLNVYYIHFLCSLVVLGWVKFKLGSIRLYQSQAVIFH
jgi:hypothetical protein